ncbi:MAG: transposase [Verrucomicrobia bacterium]|nr:transposase [Verrucomicrobiota bacterium]
MILQDKARFGRMGRTRRCGAQALALPKANNGEEREFAYVYGPVSPLEGELDWMICDQINTERLGEFLAQVSAARPHECTGMIVDSASSPFGKTLVVPEKILLHRRPPSAPQRNPQEHLWKELPEKAFPNRIWSPSKASGNEHELAIPLPTTPPKANQSPLN